MTSAAAPMVKLEFESSSQARGRMLLAVAIVVIIIDIVFTIVNRGPVTFLRKARHDACPHHLLCPMQLRAHGVAVNDCPRIYCKDPAEDSHAIVATDEYGDEVILSFYLRN